MRDELTFLLGGEGTFDKKNATGYLVNGMNHVRLNLRNIGYNAHIHPGMLIRIDYTLNGTMVYSNFSSDNFFSERYYFDNLTSFEGEDGKSGAWAIMPFFIPEDAANISAAVHIEGKNILDYKGGGWFSSWSGLKKRKDYDYIFFINSEYPFDYDSAPPKNPSYDYSSAELADEIVTGTNVVSVYFNNYGDNEWGGGMPGIYSDPLHDPEHSSYIEVNYSLPAGDTPYGSIRLNQVKEFGGGLDYIKETSFSFPQDAKQIGNVFTHIVQQYSYKVDVKSDIYTPPSNLVFRSPSSRAVPTTVYIPKNVLDSSPTANNYIRVIDLNRNDIRPETSVEYNFYLPAFVGYGGVFATEEEANSDAVQRLNDALGEFMSSDDITIETSEMRDVPTMWGPSVVEVRVWQ